MDIDSNIELSSLKKVVQTNAAENRRLELKNEQLIKEQKVAYKGLEKDKFEILRRNPSAKARFSQHKLSDNSDYSTNDSKSESDDRMQRTYSLKENWTRKKNSDTSIANKNCSIREEFETTNLYKQKSLNSISTGNLNAANSDEQQQPLSNWQRNLLERIRTHKYQAEIRNESAQITARMTGTGVVGNSASKLENGKKNQSNCVALTKPSYMQTTAASRARIN